MSGYNQEEHLRIITFFLGKDEFGVNILNVHSIIKMMEITPIPRAPQFIEGVINLRGEVIPAVDLRTRFDIPPENKEEPKLLIMEFSSKLVAFIIDDVASVIPVNRKDVIPRPPVHLHELDDDCIQGVIPRDDELISLLDLEKVFTSKEAEALVTVEIL